MSLVLPNLGQGFSPSKGHLRTITSAGNLLLKSAISVEKDIFSSTFRTVGKTV